MNSIYQKIGGFHDRDVVGIRPSEEEDLQLRRFLRGNTVQGSHVPRVQPIVKACESWIRSLIGRAVLGGVLAQGFHLTEFHVYMCYRPVVL